jgi:ketosteroid isomerase-like protein
VKQRIVILSLAIAIMTLMNACQTGGPGSGAAGANTSANSQAKAVATPTADEIRAVLAAHDKALNEKNLDAVMATFSTDPKTVVLGTGTEERWMGPQEIRAAYTEIFKDYDPGTLVTDCSEWKAGGADEAGTMAWLAATCDCKDSLKGKSRDYKMNVSGTVEKQNNKWVFVSLHMSNAFEPPPVTK